MSLDTSALEDAVAAQMDESPDTIADAAAAWATVYDDYCQGATFGASVPTLTGRKAAFESVLLASLSSGVFATVCTAFGNAVAAYWLAVPVTGPQTGVVPTCPGASAIAAALAALAPVATREVAAATLAAALDTATRTCTATVSPPPGTVLPIA